MRMINADRGPSVAPPARPCWYCVYWAGPCWGDPYMADCRHGGTKSCVADAAHGCVHWEREPGVDDDGWAPAPIVRPMSPTGIPAEVDAELDKVIHQIQARPRIPPVAK
jgi:hypothetical protein